MVIPSIFRRSGEKNPAKERAEKNPCIGCDLCLEVCEEGLWPDLLYEHARGGRYEECRRLGIDYCTDCDDCTHECPADVPLSKYLRVARVLSFYKGNKSGLIPVLLEVQANFGYLPIETIKSVADFLNVSEGHIYSVASFYKRLRLTPPGRQHIRVWQGTACHIRGASQVLRHLEKATGINEGETSPDMEYTLDSVACVGCCALAPVVTVNNKVYGKMDDEKVKKILGNGGNKK
jgi:NADH-quinone oxidoreductase subunit E